MLALQVRSQIGLERITDLVVGQMRGHGPSSPRLPGVDSTPGTGGELRVRVVGLNTLSDHDMIVLTGIIVLRACIRPHVNASRFFPAWNRLNAAE